MASASSLQWAGQPIEAPLNMLSEAAPTTELEPADNPSSTESPRIDGGATLVESFTHNRGSVAVSLDSGQDAMPADRQMSFHTDGRVKNPIPSKLKSMDSKNGNFSVMHIDLTTSEASQRNAAAKRTSQETAAAAQLANKGGYQSIKRNKLAWKPHDTSLQGDAKLRGLEPQAAKIEQARLLTLLRSLHPIAVVDQLCKALAYFGDIPGAPPPSSGHFPESARNNGPGSLFVGWLAEIFPPMGTTKPADPMPNVEVVEKPPSLPPPVEVAPVEVAPITSPMPPGSPSPKNSPIPTSAPSPPRRRRGRPKGSKSSKPRKDKGIKKGSQKTVAEISLNHAQAGSTLSQGGRPAGMHPDDEIASQVTTRTEPELSESTQHSVGYTELNSSFTSSPGFKKRGRPKGSKNRLRDDLDGDRESPPAGERTSSQGPARRISSPPAVRIRDTAQRQRPVSMAKSNNQGLQQTAPQVHATTSPDNFVRALPGEAPQVPASVTITRDGHNPDHISKAKRQRVSRGSDAAAVDRRAELNHSMAAERAFNASFNNKAVTESASNRFGMPYFAAALPEDLADGSNQRRQTGQQPSAQRQVQQQKHGDQYSKNIIDDLTPQYQPGNSLTVTASQKPNQAAHSYGSQNTNRQSHAYSKGPVSNQGRLDTASINVPEQSRPFSTYEARPYTSVLDSRGNQRALENPNASFDAPTQQIETVWPDSAAPRRFYHTTDRQ